MIPTSGEPVAFPPELRERLAQGDPAALARFFDATFDRVYGYLRRFVADEHAAEDLTQDVFLQVHRSLTTYDPARDPRPWLFAIATNKLRDHWRSRKAAGDVEPGLDEEELGAREASLAPAPEAVLGEEELALRVRAAIDALPPALRATTVLRVHESLPFEEIARIVGSNEVAVRKRYSRALAALRETLGELWRAHAGDPR